MLEKWNLKKNNPKIASTSLNITPPHKYREVNPFLKLSRFFLLWKLLLENVYSNLSKVFLKIGTSETSDGDNKSNSPTDEAGCFFWLPLSCFSA